MNINELRKHFDEQDYDKKYQDIEILSFIGYTESYKSWKNIEYLSIEWKDKVICDLGCFHGYFGIKAIKEGASKIIGLDRSSTVLKTAQMITDLSNAFDVTEYKVWEGGSDIPECDMIMCLNVLHHFEDKDLALSKMNTDALFEINMDDLVLVQKYFNVEQSINSHRQNRQIYFCKRK